MTYSYTLDEKAGGYYSSNAANYPDAPDYLNSSYVIASGLWNAANGLLSNNNYIADTDVYSMGLLSAGTYTVVASSAYWFYGTGYASYITPTLTIYNSYGGVVSTSYIGTQTFNVTSADTYYAAVTGVTYSASQYELYYTYQAPATTDPTSTTGETWIGDNSNNYHTGTSYGDTLYGMGGNDTLNGGAGHDIMFGGAGNDTYYVDNTFDIVIETAGNGIDLVVTYLKTYTLGANVENLNYLGTSTANFNGKGNALDNYIWSWDGNDVLSGLGGNDVLHGMGGNDTLNGGAGNDILVGDAGKDILIGGAGADKFVFNSTSDSAAGSTRDVIKDFVHGTDKIDLSEFDANTLVAGIQSFTLIASHAAFTSAGQIKFVNGAAGGILYGEVHGHNAADFSIALTGIHSVTASDFIL